MAESIDNAARINDGTTETVTTTGLNAQADNVYVDMSESMEALMAQAMGKIESRLEDMLTGNVEAILTNIATARSTQNSHNVAKATGEREPTHNVANMGSWDPGGW